MTETPEALDPFGPDAAPGISLIVQLRIYDVLMALLGHFDETAQQNLLELHATGAVLSTAPNFNGVFVADEMESQNVGEEPLKFDEPQFDYQ